MRDVSLSASGQFSVISKVGSSKPPNMSVEPQPVDRPDFANRPERLTLEARNRPRPTRHGRDPHRVKKLRSRNQPPPPLEVQSSEQDLTFLLRDPPKYDSRRRVSLVWFSPPHPGSVLCDPYRVAGIF